MKGRKGRVRDLEGTLRDKDRYVCCCEKKRLINKLFVCIYILWFSVFSFVFGYVILEYIKIEGYEEGYCIVKDHFYKNNEYHIIFILENAESTEIDGLDKIVDKEEYEYLKHKDSYMKCAYDDEENVIFEPRPYIFDIVTFFIAMVLTFALIAYLYIVVSEWYHKSFLKPEKIRTPSIQLTTEPANENSNALSLKTICVNYITNNIEIYREDILTAQRDIKNLFINSY